jgi:hypothetical protein
MSIIEIILSSNTAYVLLLYLISAKVQSRRFKETISHTLGWSEYTDSVIAKPWIQNNKHMLCWFQNWIFHNFFLKIYRSQTDYAPYACIYKLNTNLWTPKYTQETILYICILSIHFNLIFISKIQIDWILKWKKKNLYTIFVFLN